MPFILDVNQGNVRGNNNFLWFLACFSLVYS